MIKPPEGAAQTRDETVKPAVSELTAIHERLWRLEDELSALRKELDALKERVWRKTRHQGAG